MMLSNESQLAMFYRKLIVQFSGDSLDTFLNKEASQSDLLIF